MWTYFFVKNIRRIRMQENAFCLLLKKQKAVCLNFCETLGKQMNFIVRIVSNRNFWKKFSKENVPKDFISKLIITRN